jgi:lipopolysaccharide transport system ATP-binding protein
MRKAVRVIDLSKCYALRHEARERYVALRDVLSLGLRSVFARKTPSGDTSSPVEKFWALDHVSFDVEHGARIGIVGRNGAGKSTILKILSRIAEPTTGRIEISGRVTSLLEVGTGFHPELTGRENIFLSGSILGMARREIRQRFDEIVEFSEVEKFLDTPVKRYSSGMYVRLAFAIAAHLDSDILLVDEVLAVGDYAFQRKCLGRMSQLRNAGRTLVFVSHNMGAVAQLCDEAIWIRQGRLVAQGMVSEVVSRYLVDISDGSGSIRFEASAWKKIYFSNLQVRSSDASTTTVFGVQSPIVVELYYCVRAPAPECELSLRICSGTGVRVFTVNRSMSLRSPLLQGSYSASVEIPAGFLAPGSYYVDVAAHTPNVEMHDFRESALSFTVAETGSNLAAYAGADTGLVLADFPWREQGPA